MAKITHATDEEEAEWQAWVAERPPVVQAACRKVRPDILYRHTITGQRVFVVSYGENGTVTVAVTGEFNRCAFDTEVFGVDPDKLVECDLPEPGEQLGCFLTIPAEIEAYIELMRKARKESKKISS